MERDIDCTQNTIPTTHPTHTTHMTQKEREREGENLFWCRGNVFLERKRSESRGSRTLTEHRLRRTKATLDFYFLLKANNFSWSFPCWPAKAKLHLLVCNLALFSARDLLSTAWTREEGTAAGALGGARKGPAVSAA
jgi:hypothetical protein